MKKMFLLFVLVFCLIISSCSKSDDEDNEPYYLYFLELAEDSNCEKRLYNGTVSLDKEEYLRIINTYEIDQCPFVTGMDRYGDNFSGYLFDIIKFDGPEYWPGIGPHF